MATDDKTDRRLLLLVGLVVVSATIFVFWAVPGLGALRDEPLFPIALTGLIAITNGRAFNIRIRSQQRLVSSTSAAILVTVALLPAQAVVVCTLLGVGIAKVLAQKDPIKIAFNTGKDTIAAGAAALAAGAAGIVPAFTSDATVPWQSTVIGLLAGFVAYSVVDDVLSTTVLALATRTPWRQVAIGKWDIMIGARVGNLLVAIVTSIIVDQTPTLLLAMPPTVWALQLTHANRLRSGAEREAWQRLAQTTDELNVVELDSVLRTAVTRAAQVFSADEVEVELRGGSTRLVRGTVEEITFDGPPEQAPLRAGTLIPAPLEGYDGGADIGVLRLFFRAPVRLTEREQYTLRTFASALCTAVRNASAYSELERIADDHAHAAAHDPLTGLANRRYLLERGNELLARRQAEGATALLLIDLNHFKEVNDTLGHAAGDRVLIEVAERLRAASSPGDLVARLGGDEFAVLFTGLPAPALAQHRAQTLLAALNPPIALEGMRITVEASGGIAPAPADGGVSELLRRADVAMYQAKRSGQQIAVYVRARDTADIGRLTLGGELARAVAEHEFTVNFQPIVDLGSGEVLAAEALARWHHPDRGNLDPRRFLDAVERSGLLPAFSEAVLDQALVAADGWRDAGFDLPVAVNVSPRSLLDPRFPAVVVGKLEEHGVDPDRLYLELTETLTISQLEVVDRVLGELRDAGIRLALDDFGTGYSSLSVLSRIPVHELKIDRAFVGAMDTSAEASAVVRSTVDLGRSLNLAVVAEGVESEPQRRALWELGCAAGQGHLFARPQPAPRLLAALRRGSGGRPGTLAAPLHDEGSVIRMPTTRRTGRSKQGRLPHWPA